MTVDRIAIVGRPNVGKSTLFNRLAGRRLAIVDDTPGVTRDRREGDARLGDLRFRIVDTAGFEDARGGDLAARIQAQTARALNGADAALFLIDAREGLTPLDRELAADAAPRRIARRPVANKCEGRAGEAGLADAYGLGLGEPIPAVRRTRRGPGPPLRRRSASRRCGEREPQPTPALAPHRGRRRATAAAPAPLQLAIVGRPNVGKSTLINRLIGDERLVTGPEAGITRDAVAVDWTFRRTGRCACSTPPGLRRRARIDDKLEELAGADTLRAIRFAQVVVIVVDATAGLEKQDLTIADLVIEEGRAPVLALNKWDRVVDRKAAQDAVASRLEHSLPQVRGLRVVPLSALTGEGLDELLPTVLQVYDVWNRHAADAAAEPLARRHDRPGRPPPSARGRPVKIRYMAQTKARPPSFVLIRQPPAGGAGVLPALSRQRPAR